MAYRTYFAERSTVARITNGTVSLTAVPAGWLIGFGCWESVGEPDGEGGASRRGARQPLPVRVHVQARRREASPASGGLAPARAPPGSQHRRRAMIVTGADSVLSA